MICGRDLPSFLVCGNSVISAPFVERLIFFPKSQVLFLDIHLCAIDIISISIYISILKHASFDYCCFLVVLKLLFSILFWLFGVPYNSIMYFRISLPSSTKKPAVIVIGIVVSLQFACIVCMAIFTTVSLLVLLTRDAVPFVRSLFLFQQSFQRCIL